jgi:hypothetical protein
VTVSNRPLSAGVVEGVGVASLGFEQGGADREVLGSCVGDGFEDLGLGVGED